MPKFLGNRVGSSVNSSDDGGLFNLHSQQIFFRILQKWPPLFGVTSTNATVTDNNTTRQRYHVFKSDGSFSVSNPGIIHYTVVAGGGGGGFGHTYADYCGGGGGAGGFRSGTLEVDTGTYTITVGNGGIGAKRTNPITNATNGGDSSISGPTEFGTITSTGGGAGAWFWSPFPSSFRSVAQNGGSGGGGNSDGPTSPTDTSIGGSGNTPPVSPPQGNNGGNGNSSSVPISTRALSGAGGGGASTSGGDATKTSIENAGNGGSGRVFGVIAEDFIAGIGVTLLAGGGGGGGWGNNWPVSEPDSPNAGTGNYGGGNGGNGRTTSINPPYRGEPGYSGDANTGGGGGGGSSGDVPSIPSIPSNPYYGGDGGSGIIIISHSF